MRNQKLLPIHLAVIIALAATGVAYAHWSQTLQIQGTILTGELDWEFTMVTCLDTSGNDYHCRDGFAGPPPYFWMGDKDVGSTSCEVTDSHTVTVTLNNVYPCYFNSVTLYVDAAGTIPITFEKVIIDGNEITSEPAPVIKLDLNGDDLDDIEILWKNTLGTQREPGESFPAMSFWLHVLQDAPRGTALSFTIELVGIQWNMYTPP